MKGLIYYLLQVIIASGILYIYYHLALRNKKFHQYNRFYLLAAFVISILIPFLNIPVYFTSHETESSFILQTLTSISYSTTEETVPAVIYPSTAKTNWFTWQNFIYILYISIAVIVLIRILLSLKRIRSIIKSNPVEKIENIHFVNTDEPGTPFSFFRWLFWNRQIKLQSEKGEQIFRHELFHIQQGHSRDIIFIEFLMIIFWMNPFFYLMKKEIKAIHEFLADKFATNEHNKWDYAELLLMQALGSKQHLTNSFFHNQIKRRIAMIINPKKTSHQYLRKIMVLPVTLAILALVAFKYKTRQNIEQANDIYKNENLTDSIKDTATTINKIELKDDIGIKKSNGDLKYFSNAIAKYGSKGKNGVIEIKTKKTESITGRAEMATIYEKNGNKIEIRPTTLPDSKKGVEVTTNESILTSEMATIDQKNGNKIEIRPTTLPDSKNGVEVTVRKKVNPRDMASKDYSNPSDLSFDDPEFKKQWRKNVSDIKAIAWREGKAAYEYKGRTYVFGQIKNSDSTVASFTEQNGVHHTFLLNGQLVKSVEDLNKLITRNDVINFGFIDETEAMKRFNREETIVFIETFADPIKKN
jgi:beta-lactamase regulating signal transducer with metallopeptidase domain